MNSHCFNCPACGNARNSRWHRSQAALCQKKTQRAIKAVNNRLTTNVDHYEHARMVESELRAMRERAA